MPVDEPAILLQAREAELSAIYQNVPGIVFYIAVEKEDEFRFQSVSQEFLRATGLNRDQVVGALVCDVIPRPSCDIVLGHYREAIRSGRPVRWEEESEYPSGRRYGEVAVTPLFDAGGTATHLIGIVHDITERKRMETERADEDRRKDEFLSFLGHELRNPLAAVSTAVQLLAGEVAEGERAALNQMMDRQVRLMQRLVDDLLDLSRIKRGYIRLTHDSIDLTKFLQHVTGLTQSLRAKRNQEMVLRPPSERVRFLADEPRMEQIAINLLSNASKYTGDGGTIELCGSIEGTEVVLRCKDNGRGIPLEMHQKIFEPFVCVEPRIDSGGEASLGIGLALTKQLVELHGGRIGVECGGTGMGSEFWVRLPLRPAPSDEPSAPAPKSPLMSQASGSVTLVEDNPDVARSLALALERAGYRVTHFADPLSALEGLSHSQPNAILLDIGLPGMDGYSMAARLRKQPGLRHTVIIGISGYNRKKPPDVPADFDYYLTKPVNLGCLLKILGSPFDEKKGPPAHAHHLPENNGPHVLLIEDHAGVAQVVAKLLKRRGLEVRTAATGEEGVRLASEFRPALVVCDLNLPDMPGTEVLRRIRATPDSQNAYSIILTAQSETEIRSLTETGRDMGVDRFISKAAFAGAIDSLLAGLNLNAEGPIGAGNKGEL
jgi:two-component system CheB/CheR fusion protein